VEHLDRSVARQMTRDTGLSRACAFWARHEKDIAADEVKEAAQHGEGKQREQIGI
jgi:hypothetical protein